MMKQWERLLARLGLKREAVTRSFALDASLHSALVVQAEQEKRPVEELYADLLTTALVHRQTNSVLRDRWQTLSRRGQEVTALACRGYTNRQMAARLGVSEETVKTHVRNALVKFNLHGKAEMRMALGGWDFSEWDY
jgi:DNA-binding CsgD family transcriptional regulator